MTNQIKKDLEELGLSHNETQVYLALTQLGESTAAHIAKKANLPRTTTISILEKLEQNGYLTLHRFKGANYYWIEPPKTLQDILRNKLSLAENLDKLLKDLYRSEAHFPFANVYDTKNGIKNFIERKLTSLERKSFIYTIDTPHIGNYDKVLSADFNHLLLSSKKAKDIVTYTLVPAGSYKVIDSKKLKAQSIIIRELPEGLDFSASVWFLDKSLILFSGTPPFIVEIRHEAIVESLKSLYDFLWRISSPANEQ